MRAEAERKRHASLALYRLPKPVLPRVVAGEAPHLAHFSLG